jgi:ArsR family transcriptional regulator, virulence genes transcriptional regulator
MPKLPFHRRSEFLDMMANEQRFNVLEILSQEEVAVTALSKKVGLRQATLSHHLSKLRSADMVATRRKAQTVYYSVECPHVRALLNSLADIFEPAGDDRSSDKSD